MKQRILIALTALAMAPSFAQAPQTPQAYTVDSNGSDVRSVLHKLFTQAGKSFVVDPGAYYSLYLNLNGVTFESALDVICKNAGLDYELQTGGLYHFSKPKTLKAQVTALPPMMEPVVRQLDPSVLNKKVTTRLQGAEIRTVLRQLSAQAGVTIEVSPEVRNLRVNAMLISTSLRYALNSITGAARLTYSLTNIGTILVSDPGAKLATSTQTATAAIAAKPACDQCKATLEKGWKYCPHCGNYVKAITK